jgi:hypothetical protein
MNIDVTALQAVPEIAAAPEGLRPKMCKKTKQKCEPNVKTCEVTIVFVIDDGGLDF